MVLACWPHVEFEILDCPRITPLACFSKQPVSVVLGCARPWWSGSSTQMLNPPTTINYIRTDLSVDSSCDDQFSASLFIHLHFSSFITISPYASASLFVRPHLFSFLFISLHLSLSSFISKLHRLRIGASEIEQRLDEISAAPDNNPPDSPALIYIRNTLQYITPFIKGTLPLHRNWLVSIVSYFT